MELRILNHQYIPEKKNGDQNDDFHIFDFITVKSLLWHLKTTNLVNSTKTLEFARKTQIDVQERREET